MTIRTRFQLSQFGEKKSLDGEITLKLQNANHDFSRISVTLKTGVSLAIREKKIIKNIFK